MSWNECKEPGCGNYAYRPDVDWCETHRKVKVIKVANKRKNTFLCSDGSKVTQDQINEKLRRHYSLFKREAVCEGCSRAAESHAHIISQSRCKKIGKTELIWSRENWFYGCNKCNAAIENPKGKAWKSLKNIDKCIQFIYEHDKELYFKFEAQGWKDLTVKEH